MERIEVNVQTGEIQTVQLTPDEVAVAQTQYAAWENQQQSVIPDLTINDLMKKITVLTEELNALKNKVGS